MRLNLPTRKTEGMIFIQAPKVVPMRGPPLALQEALMLNCIVVAKERLRGPPLALQEALMLICIVRLMVMSRGPPLALQEALMLISIGLMVTWLRFIHHQQQQSRNHLGTTITQVASNSCRLHSIARSTCFLVWHTVRSTARFHIMVSYNLSIRTHWGSSFASLLHLVP